MAKPPPKDPGSIEGLVEIMAALRDPNGGCPWDLEQTFATIAPYTIEEAYEVADAIHERDMEGLKGELGDLLFQVVYHAQMAEEAGHFDFGDVVKSISEKMLRRHPHVFGEVDIATAEAQTRNWEEIKAAERKAAKQESFLDDVPRALPALTRAEKLTKRVARVGFDWQSPETVYAKLEEEIGEVKDAAASGDKAAIQDELGDVLFVAANLCRKYGVDPEVALAGTNRKFTARFQFIEAEARKQGKTLEDMSLGEMDELWEAAKAFDPK